MSLTAQRDELVQQPARRPFTALARFVPVLVLAVFVVALLLRSGVDAADIVRYALYWVIAVVLPGLVVSRSLLRVRATIVEDLAVGAITGVSLEVLSWVVGVTTGIGAVVRFWWMLVLLAGALVPAMRRRVLVRVPERVPVPHSVALVVIVGYLLTLLKFGSYVFRSGLPPRAGSTYVDMWWQLSLVQELGKYESPQTPQVAGEPFSYHYFANVSMASGSRLSGVAPEVVTFRLWYIPIVVLSVGMAVVLGRALTRSLTAGVVLAGLSYALVVKTYIWPSQLAGLALSPLAWTSPSQLLGNIGLTTCAFGAALLLRGGASRSAVAWVVLIVLGASADKSTVLPILLAGTVVAAGRAVWTRSWATARWLGVGVVGLLAVQAVIVSQAAGTAGGKLTILGPLRFQPAFYALTPIRELRAMNDGLFLDSITSARTLGYALLALTVTLGLHVVRLAGVAGLFRRSVRVNYMAWWLAGGTLAGYVLLLSIDHIGVSEVFFGMAGGLLGTALLVVVLWDALSRLGRTRGRVLIGAGLAAGCVIALLVEAVVAVAEATVDYGPVARIAVPLVAFVVIAVLAAVIARLVRRRGRRQWSKDASWVMVFAAIVGIAIPSAVLLPVNVVAHRSGAFAIDLPEQVTPNQQRAMLWLRSHSNANDVVATNAYCDAVVTTPRCPARSFWISGLSGRRVVLEGWAYTPQVQTQQGVGGLPYDKQPSPFPERFRLDRQVFGHDSIAALEELRSRYHVRWLVSVHQAGRTPSLPDSVAPVRFDNGAVTIFEVRK